MKFIASLYVERPQGFDLPFVDPSITRLSVVVSTSDDPKYSFLAYGVDPSTIDAAERDFVFQRHVDVDHLGAFLKIIADGKLDEAAKPPPRPRASVAALSGAAVGDGGVVGYSVDIGNTVPRPPGPSAQVVFTYGDTAATSTTVVNA
jgi:hypothetical protein